MQLFRGSKILNFGLHDFMFVCVGLGGGYIYTYLKNPLKCKTFLVADYHTSSWIIQFWEPSRASWRRTSIAK